MSVQVNQDRRLLDLAVEGDTHADRDRRGRRGRAIRRPGAGGLRPQGPAHREGLRRATRPRRCRVPSGFSPTRARCPRSRRPRCTSAMSPSRPPVTTRPTSPWRCWPRPSSGSAGWSRGSTTPATTGCSPRRWGIDVAVSTPMALVAAVEGAIDVGHLVRLMDLGKGLPSRLGQGTGERREADACPRTARWSASGCATSRCRTTAPWSRCCAVTASFIPEPDDDPAGRRRDAVHLRVRRRGPDQGDGAAATARRRLGRLQSQSG